MFIKVQRCSSRIALMRSGLGFFLRCRNPDTRGKVCGNINYLLFLKNKLQDIRFLERSAAFYTPIKLGSKHEFLGRIIGLQCSEIQIQKALSRVTCVVCDFRIIQRGRQNFLGLCFKVDIIMISLVRFSIECYSSKWFFQCLFLFL